MEENKDIDEEYENFEKLSLDCERLLKDTEKNRAKEALQYLKKKLGDGVLRDERHPIRNWAILLEPYMCRWWIILADKIKESEKIKNHSELLKKIKRKEEFEEGFSVLDMTYRFSKVGFEISIDPKIFSSNKTKIPDLKLTNKNTQEFILVEISGKKQVYLKYLSMHTTSRITGALWGAPYIAGHIHKIFSDRHLDHIVKEIKLMVEQSKKDNLFHSYIKEGEIEIGIAPKNDKDNFQIWASKRELEIGTIYVPPFDACDIKKLAAKIKEEAKHFELSRDIPAIIIIPSDNLFRHTCHNEDIRKLISELEEVLYDYPNILYVLITCTYMWKDRNGDINRNRNFQKDEHMFVERIIDIRESTGEKLIDQYIILFNKFSDFSNTISSDTVTKIENAFKNWRFEC